MAEEGVEGGMLEPTARDSGYRYYRTQITGRRAFGSSSLLRREPANPVLVANVLPSQFLIHHHGRPQDFVGTYPLHFQPAAEAQHGLDLVVRAAGLPYRGQDQGKLRGAQSSSSEENPWLTNALLSRDLMSS